MKKLKKTAKKKTVKTQEKTRALRAVKKEISHAVDAIPGLIIEHAQHHTPSLDIDNNKPNDVIENITAETPAYLPPKHSGVLLWIGVSLLTIAVVGLWSWTMRDAIVAITKTPSAEKNMIAEAGKDFGDILKYLEDQDTITAKLKELETTTTINTTEDTKQKLITSLAVALNSTTTKP